ncbi:MAG: P-II family nitrogen regulator [Clostridiales Family XIII bacterium]|jgi:nitrogen regulatory protein PII|nr:P-II family nitrogen regulator [Clostridiales Family XIII bacterium]
MTDYSNTEFGLIVTIVNRGYADTVIDAAREAGARGGTVLYARGTGIHETEKFMNISIQPEKEMVLTLVRKGAVKDVTHAILIAAGLKTQGRGISFTLPVTDVVGIVTDFESYEKGESSEENSQ